MKNYKKPEMEIVNFETADVLMTSCDISLDEFELKVEGNQAKRYNSKWIS